ncbi:DUF305 domain-containing protein [Candidatus Nanohalobium constans]|uniref:DUF305 domain-containing protein n=1 Tax=Candidatus Nanohalobium constans TaxID=2565781 RepID=A0A5Q0UH04_9ARCH|nr:DUF305 domain-containing protein [Candidatus Nanohalobium constans]QGA80897.1 hypothetical protein LC1Nh_1023 [Candidatus Nanohalobium constans]
MTAVSHEKIKNKLKPNSKIATASIILVLTTLITLTALNTQENQDDQGFNRADLMFMNMMIVHHNQAIEMAEMAENRTENENILELSNNISKAQREENRQMTKWMQNQGFEPGNHHRMAGMASEQQMQQLRENNGTEFNHLFAKLMIEHHQGGIAMAEQFHQTGKNTELKQMQQQMIDAQTEEIKKMRKWQREDQL